MTVFSNRADAAHGQAVQPRSKRPFDILLSGICLALLSPFIVGVGLLIRIVDGPPVFFRQERIGWREAPFTLFKFRTMRAAAHGETPLLTDAARATNVGSWLRKHSVDELPQLWNVFRGDMSMVGPRPLLAIHLELATLAQRRRYAVRPGITGLAQIAGRQNLSFSQRYDLDLRYVDQRSFTGDVRILARTALDLVRPHGVETGQSLQDVDDIGLERAIGRG